MVGVEIGNVYDYFDDGKIKPSRRSKVKIEKIIPFSKIDKEILAQWETESKECDWIYNSTTDYFPLSIFNIIPGTSGFNDQPFHQAKKLLA